MLALNGDGDFVSLKNSRVSLPSSTESEICGGVVSKRGLAQKRYKLQVPADLPAAALQPSQSRLRKFWLFRYSAIRLQSFCTVGSLSRSRKSSVQHNFLNT